MGGTAASLAKYDGKTKADRLGEGERILSDWNNGVPVSELMSRYGLSRASVYRRRDDAIKARIAPHADAFREAAGAKLAEVMRGLQQNIDAAEVAAQQAAAEGEEGRLMKWLQLRGEWLDKQRAVEADRRRLYGLDMPVKVEATVTVTDGVDARIAELTAQMATLDG